MFTPLRGRFVCYIEPVEHRKERQLASMCGLKTWRGNRRIVSGDLRQILKCQKIRQLSLDNFYTVHRELALIRAQYRAKAVVFELMNWWLVDCDPDCYEFSQSSNISIYSLSSRCGYCSLSGIIWSSSSLRRIPTILSANGFCHGQWYAVRISSIPQLLRKTESSSLAFHDPFSQL